MVLKCTERNSHALNIKYVGFFRKLMFRDFLGRPSRHFIKYFGESGKGVAQTGSAWGVAISVSESYRNYLYETPEVKTLYLL